MQGQNEICSGAGTNITLSRVDQVLRKSDFWRLCCYGPCPIRQRQVPSRANMFTISQMVPITLKKAAIKMTHGAPLELYSADC